MTNTFAKTKDFPEILKRTSGTKADASNLFRSFQGGLQH